MSVMSSIIKLLMYMLIYELLMWWNNKNWKIHKKQSDFSSRIPWLSELAMEEQVSYREALLLKELPIIMMVLFVTKVYDNLWNNIVLNNVSNWKTFWSSIWNQIAIYWIRKFPFSISFKIQNTWKLVMIKINSKIS